MTVIAEDLPEIDKELTSQEKLQLLLQETERILGPDDVATTQVRRRYEQALMKEGGRRQTAGPGGAHPAAEHSPRHDDSDSIL